MTLPAAEVLYSAGLPRNQPLDLIVYVFWDAQIAQELNKSLHWQYMNLVYTVTLVEQIDVVLKYCFSDEDAVSGQTIDGEWRTVPGGTSHAS